MNTKEPSNWFLWVNARWGGRDVGRWSGWRSVVRMSTCRFSYYLALWCRKQVIDWIYLFNVQADGNHQLFRENILSVFNAHSNSMNANAKPWQCAFRFFFFFFIPLFVDGERIDCEACLWLECSQIVFFFVTIIQLSPAWRILAVLWYRFSHQNALHFLPVSYAS